MDLDALPEARELHARKRRWLLVLGGNLTVLVVMLGLPWLRGYLRTRTLWEAFGAYGACLLDGETVPTPGLGMPVGHEARFATRALRDPAFYARCDDALGALAPGEVTFLMPDVKTAENDLRGAVALVRSELLPLAVRTPGSRLSRRPLAALERLRAALANHTRATGAVDVPERDAFALRKGDAVLPTPARLPIAAGGIAQISLWSAGDALHALALDASHLSYLALRGGKLEQVRFARPKLLEAVLPHAAPDTFVWAMPRARCAERATGCADKSLGIATLALPLRDAPAPRWLGGHPSGRPDRTMHVDAAHARVLAELRDGASELRTFDLTQHAGASGEAPLSGTATGPHVVSGSPLLLTREAASEVFTASAVDDTTVLRAVGADESQVLAAQPGTSAPWLVGCRDDDGLGLAFGNDAGVRLVNVDGAGAPTSWEPVALALRDVVHVSDPRRDRVQRVCGIAGQAVALTLAQGDRLSLVRCRVGEQVCRVEPVAGSVYGFAALRWGERLVIAYAGAGDLNQVRVRTVALDAPLSDAEQVPAACWSDGEGLCGLPLLARAGPRLLLAARTGADLGVVESADGLTWSTLRELAKPE